MKPYNTALPAHAIALPPDQTDGAWSKLVHQDAEWKRGGAEQEGANGETQIQHLFLVHAGEIFFYLAAGGRVAQRHDHGIVLCEEGQRARSQERTAGTSRAPLGACSGPVIGYLDWIPTVNYSPPWLVVAVTLWDASVMQHTF